MLADARGELRLRAQAPTRRTNKARMLRLIDLPSLAFTHRLTRTGSIRMETTLETLSFVEAPTANSLSGHTAANGIEAVVKLAERFHGTNTDRTRQRTWLWRYKPAPRRVGLIHGRDGSRPRRDDMSGSASEGVASVSHLRECPKCRRAVLSKDLVLQLLRTPDGMVVPDGTGLDGDGPWGVHVESDLVGAWLR